MIFVDDEHFDGDEIEYFPCDACGIKGFDEYELNVTCDNQYLCDDCYEDYLEWERESDEYMSDDEDL